MHKKYEIQLERLQQEVAELKQKNIRISDLANVNERIQRQQSEEFLSSQQRFRTVFECSPIGNKIIDKDLRILQANMAMVKLLGFSCKQEVIGTKILDYTPEGYIADWKFLQQQLWTENSQTFTLESALIRADGELIRCRITSILFLDQGETMGYTSIEDITDQYLLRQQKEEFISVASHELKTPVTTLKGSIQLIQKLLLSEKTLPKGIISLANKASAGVSRLAHLIDNLLSTNRLEQGQLSLNAGWFEIGAILELCCEHLLSQGNYFLTYQGDPALKIYGDQYKIEQVLANLVNNAVKYAPGSSEIILSAEQLENSVRISIIDKGEGIPASVQPHLFDRYYRVDTQVIKKESGLGLGLYICAEIIRRHGGEMGVESTEGQGSRFWFILPTA